MLSGFIVEKSSCLLLKFLSVHLQEFGHKVAFYHGQMDPDERNYVQRMWSKDEVNLICATVAFGMGMCIHSILKRKFLRNSEISIFH